MIALRYARLWQLTSIFLLALVLTAALLPNLPFDEWTSRFRNVDKVKHVVAFVLLSVWFSGQYTRSSYWRIALGLIAFGGFIELAQGTVSYRSSEWLDLTGDVIGIAVGLGIAASGAGGWAMRVEEWLAS